MNSYDKPVIMNFDNLVIAKYVPSAGTIVI